MDDDIKAIRMSLLRRLGTGAPLGPDEGEFAFERHILLAIRVHSAAALNQTRSGETKGWIEYFEEHFPKPSGWNAVTHGQPKAHFAPRAERDVMHQPRADVARLRAFRQRIRRASATRRCPTCDRRSAVEQESVGRAPVARGAHMATINSVRESFGDRHRASSQHRRVVESRSSATTCRIRPGGRHEVVMPKRLADPRPRHTRKVRNAPVAKVCGETTAPLRPYRRA